MEDLNKKISLYIKEHTKEAIELLETLGKIPAPSRHEEKRAEFIKDWFLNIGAENVWIDDAKNVICALEIDKHEDLTAFMAHTDIVFEDTQELPMRREGDILYAPGIGDDTANLVNLMMVAKFIIENDLSLNKGVIFVGNACEEGLGNLDGCKEIIKNYGDRINEFYSFDGYISTCTSKPVGSHRFRVDIKAQGGHSYGDFGNTNAIVEMAKLINRLYEIEIPEDEKITYNVGIIEGGTTINSIAGKSHILYEYRSPSEESLQYMKKEFDKAVNEFKEKDVDIKVELLGIRPGKGEFEEGVLEEWTEKNIEKIKKHYDGEMDLSLSSTDSNIPLSQGILANTIGTIEGDLAHTREEWVDLKSMPKGMAIVFEIVKDVISI